MSEPTGPDVSWVSEYAGLTLAQAIGKAQAEGRPCRVIEPGMAYTADFRPDRLNLEVAGDGALVRAWAG